MPILPEERKLIDSPQETPTPGWHRHGADNPFGLHRHESGEPLDGGHRHTPENPWGEHIHGEFVGLAIIDGKHMHGDDGVFLGGHNHKLDYLDTDSRRPIIAEEDKKDKKKKKDTTLTYGEMAALSSLMQEAKALTLSEKPPHSVLPIAKRRIKKWLA